MRSWNPPFWIGNRQFTAEDLTLIKTIARKFGKLSRNELAATVCENLPWKAPNGKLKVEMCSQLLESLASAGMIMLPPKKVQVHKPYELKVAPLPGTPVKCSLSSLQPVTVEPVALAEYPLWNATVAAYHPLGYRRPFGAHQRYWIKSKGSQILGAILFAAPAKALADRDTWIGWTPLERQRFLHRIVGNSRFLILPGIQVLHLASHVLALAARRLRADWQKRYGYAPVLLETFVTPPHRGTCYRAANWRFIGETGSTNRRDRKQRGHAPIKMIFAYPLVRNWRREIVLPTLAALDDEEKEADLDAQS